MYLLRKITFEIFTIFIYFIRRLFALTYVHIFYNCNINKHQTGDVKTCVNLDIGT